VRAALCGNLNGVRDYTEGTIPLYRCFCCFTAKTFGTHVGGNRHGVSIQSFINLGEMPSKFDSNSSTKKVKSQVPAY